MSEILGDRVRAPGLGADSFGWSQRRVAGADVIFLVGELDLASAPALRVRLMSVAETSTAAMIVLDLSKVRFIDAQCAGLIAAAGEAARCRGVRLRVDGLHGMPELVFDVLGLASLVGRRTEPSDGWRDPDD